MKKRSLTKDFPTVMFFAGDSGTNTVVSVEQRGLFLAIHSYIAMNPDAFDISVRSRGLFYKFTRPTVPNIAQYLFGIIESTGLEYKLPESFISEGLITIAENCEGSVRLAVQTFERCVMGELFTAEAIFSAFGMMDRTKLLGIMKKMLSGDKTAFNFLGDGLPQRVEAGVVE